MLILTGNSGTEVIKNYLDKTQDDNINLDVFIHNTDVGFKLDLEENLIKDEKYINWLNIIRENPKTKKSKDFALVRNTVPKTHTKIYVWYNDKNEISVFWSVSDNFSYNGV
ncbi:hypothetical protein [Spiroplasma endosymbiont of Polydrusus formosus]|uniref:hypothetical protein n=1 Tax=Spiroplasma endosymbiont of Polydrusus formosus TaxID=3139326 RepID=UPI0035B556E4